MNHGLLLKHFEEISEAPDSVPRLRRFILDLAVCGKLVPQDPNDEPASKLLKRIKSEKARLVASGDSKLQIPVNFATRADLGFDIPVNWAVSRLGEVAVCLDYRRIPVNGEERLKRIEGKSLDELYPYYGATQQQGWIDDYIFDAEILLLGEDGVPFFDPLRCKAYVVSGKSWVNNHAHVFRGVYVSNRFLSDWLNVFDYTGRVVGATRSKLNQSKALDIPTPLPPLSEQHRIVAKVKDLMAMCDELEAAQEKRERRRDRLVAATLHSLNNGVSGDEFRQNASFFLNHLPNLTTRPEHVQQLRQTILNLAVRGKLVPQDPGDGSGSELLDRCRKIKEQLVQERRIRGDEDVEYSIPKNKHDTPPSWEWAHVHDVALVQGGKRLPKGATFSKERTQHIYIRVTDMKNGIIMKDNLQYIAPEVHRAIAHYIINKEDLYITIAGTIGQVGRVPSFFDGHNLTENAAKIVFRGMAPDYFRVALSSDSVQMQFREKTKQMAQPKLALKRILGALFPMPPLAEQHRIAAKVDELMGLCDELEARITGGMIARRRFLGATLHEALSGQH